MFYTYNKPQFPWQRDLALLRMGVTKRELRKMKSKKKWRVYHEMQKKARGIKKTDILVSHVEIW